MNGRAGRVVFRRFVLTAAALAVAAQVMSGQVAAPPAAGRLVESTVPSAALKGNLLGDAAESRVAVYLPPGYDAAGDRRYPTLYLLHGYFGTYRTFTRGFRGMQLETMLDGLIQQGLAREMIVVVPTGRNAYFGSFYTNSSVTGGWEDFIVKELVAWADKTYRTLPRAESRGVAGHSMGGYGAIMLAMKHPDVFGALYALSPCCVGLEDDLGSDNPSWHRALAMKSREELSSNPKSLPEFFSTVFVALSAAFSPNPSSAPLYVTMPYVAEGEQLRPHPEAYAQWRAKMPLYLVEQYRTHLERLRGIYLDYGEYEEFSHIRSTTRALSEALADRGIPHTFEVYADGDHSNRIRERLQTRVFRFFSDVLTGGGQ